jgi:aryl-alcohol dehydrogenase-like predicted oxidoreductase
MKKSGTKVSAITVGTWAIGGANSLGGSFGKVDDVESVRAIHAMIDGGVNLIDTAPIYGSGHSEEVVGEALKSLDRDKVVLATKYGSYIEGGRGVHKSAPESIEHEFADSVRRLGTDYFDIYLMHWPDACGTPIKDTMTYVQKLKDQGKVKMLGLCNVDIDYIKQASGYAEIDIVQLPFSMVNQSALGQLKWCEAHDIDVMTWGSLGSGILTGTIREKPNFDKSDFRNTFYPFYKEPLFSKIQEFLKTMDKVAAKYDKPLAQIAINWSTQKSFVTTALTGVRNVHEAQENCATFGWELTQEDADLLDAELRHLGITEAAS